MTFDEQLKQVFATLTERFQTEMSRHVQATLDELASAAAAQRDLIWREALEIGRREGREEAKLETVEVDRAEDGPSASGDAVRDKGVTDSAAERLIDAIHSIDRATSLTAILETLVAYAARETARSAVLLVSGHAFAGWRFKGFQNDTDLASIQVSGQDAGILAEAARTGDSARTGNGIQAPVFAELAEGRHAVAIPLAISGQVVAVLYADAGADKITSPPSQATSAGIEIVARHAARCLESLTASGAAKGLRQQTQAPSVKNTTDRQAAGDEEEVAARRYARLLISEIKLYHEADVVTGRRERDLVTRLGGAIARARVLYEQRVPGHVRERTDHFHEELVHTLADGDATLLHVNSCK